MTDSGGGAHPTFRYQPALDGLRAVAVAMVLAFHLQVPHMTGGYLGVSVFFTLSGFLITQVLLTELADSGTLDVPKYVARRARRLLPAGLLALGLVIGLASTDQFDATRSLRRQIWAALLQVANWSDLLKGDSYADLFAAPSPVAHFWSLAIEEQFYWAWPLLLLVIVKLAHRRRPLPHFELVRLLRPIVFVLFVAAAASAPITARVWSTDAAYLATWTRAAEVLAGALLAVLARSGVRLDRLAPLALPAFVIVVVAGFVTPAGRGWAYEGGLPLYAVVTAVLLAGLQGASHLRTALSQRPLVAIGKVSYGLYLFHWPLIVWLTPDRVGIGGFWLGVLRLGAAAAAAIASYHLVEHPVRIGRWFMSPRHVAPLAAVGTGSVALLALLVPLAARPLQAAPPVLTAPSVTVSTSPAGAPPTLLTPTTGATAGTLPSVSPSVVTTEATPAGPSVIAVFGDSVPAWLLRDAAPTYDRTDVVIVNGAQEACDGYDVAIMGRDRHGRELATPDDCRGWSTSYPDLLAAAPHTPDAAVLVIGTLPVLDRKIDGVWRDPCGGIDWYLADAGRRLDYLDAQGIVPIVAVPARPGRGADFVAPPDVGERIDCIRRQMFEFLAARNVAVIDMDTILCPGGTCDESRVDGVHVKPELAPEVLDWLLDQVLAILGESGSI
jgi:peptidoglycan/LPS O-acetylase OafA/YrhL